MKRVLWCISFEQMTGSRTYFGGEHDGSVERKRMNMVRVGR